MNRPAPALSALIGLVLAAPAASANDGRNRYQLSVPVELVHVEGPAASGAGFRVLPADSEGGADGDARFRWTQEWAASIVQVAAYQTVQTLGPGPFEMAIFDLSAENGDTPVDFGGPAAGGQRRKAPRGRHPGGSHDGGINLDLGYYLTSLTGKVLKEDYAACTDHFTPGSTAPEEANMCHGPADRLDAERQAMFYLELFRMHRERFRGHLLDEVGADRAVVDALRAVLQRWKKEKKHRVTDEDLRDLDGILTHDRFGGWQRFHHHHTHVRFQNLVTTGPFRWELLDLMRRARQIRATLLQRAQPAAPAVLDVVLAVSGMERALVARVVPKDPTTTRKIRYRLEGGEWVLPDDDGDDDRYVFDAPEGVTPAERWVKVEAEVTIGSAQPAILERKVLLPVRDPRLYVAHQPGEITATAAIKAGAVSLRVAFPDRLRPLVTGARYRLFPADGGEPEVHVVDAGWFAADPAAKAPAGGTRTRSNEAALPLVLKRKAGGAALSLIQADVMFSGRLPVTVPIVTGD